MKSMVAATIVSRFKKCGVYPFNPDAIAIHTPNIASENGGTVFFRAPIHTILEIQLKYNNQVS